MVQLAYVARYFSFCHFNKKGAKGRLTLYGSGAPNGQIAIHYACGAGRWMATDPVLSRNDRPSGRPRPIPSIG